MLNRLLAVLALVLLSACGADHKWASDTEIAAARVVAGPPASITLITSVNGRSGQGAHSGLLINGAERVLYDPAGTWELTNGGAPEREDLHYGMTAGAFASFIKFQAGGIFYVKTQTILVPQALADDVIARAVAFGSASKALCSNSISAILRDVPGFEGLPNTFFPNKLHDAMAKIPGVIDQHIEDYQDGMSLTALNPAPQGSATN